MALDKNTASDEALAQDVLKKYDRVRYYGV